MTKYIKLLPPIGYYLGPNFSLTTNVGIVTPNIVTKDQLIEGINVILSNSNASQLIIKSLGEECDNQIILEITTTSTTTTSSTTTTTTIPSSKLCVKIKTID